MRNFIIKLLLKLGLIRMCELKACVIKAITCVPRKRRYPAHRNKNRFYHNGCWAVIDDSIIHFKTQQACADYIIDLSGNAVQRYDVYNALRWNNHRIVKNGKLIAEIYYEEPHK